MPYPLGVTVLGIYIWPINHGDAAPFPEYKITYYEYMRTIREGNNYGGRLLSRIIACHMWGISFYV
jgi:hypothetical protein